MAEMTQKIGAKEYPEITDLKASIYLIEAVPVVLGPMSTRSQVERGSWKARCENSFKHSRKDYVEGKVILENGDTIPAQALIWTSVCFWFLETFDYYPTSRR